MVDSSNSDRSFSGPVLLATLKYTLYRVLKTSGFATPFVVIFMVGNGVTYTDIGIGTTVMAIVVIVTEVPSGYASDRFGRKATVFVGQLFGALGATGYLFAQSTLSVVLLYVAFGLTTAIQSGSELAWFYDILKEHDAEDEYERIESRFGSVVNYLKAGTMLAGAGLFILQPFYAILAGAIANWLCVLVVITFPKNADYGEQEEKLGIGKSIETTRKFLSSSSIRTVVVIAALYAGATYASSKFIQPTTIDVLPREGLTFSGYAVPSAVVLAVLYAVYSAASGIAVSYGAKAKERLGVGGTVLFAYGFGALCMMIPFFVQILALPAMVLFMTFPSVASPAVSGYLNHHTESVARATVMSGVSFIQAIVRIPILLVSGYVADVQSPPLAMAGIGLSVIILGGIVVLFDHPVAVSVQNQGQAAD